MTEWIGIGEMARRAGVSVRTLRHYDSIGLLEATDVTLAGYRRYDEKALEKLEQILYFRELGFALEEIAAMVNHPDYDAPAAMRRQRELLCMQRARLDAMIARLDEAIGGMGTPRLEVLDMSEIERIKKQYADEAKARWGGTDAYVQSEKRTGGYSKNDWFSVQEGMNALMQRFAAVRDFDPEDDRVQALVKEWQQYITDHFYACTDEILAGLGQMYVCDERFKANMDKNGEGTAAFMSRAIEAYLAKR